MNMKLVGIIFSILLPLVGSVAYVHGTFATVYRVDKIENKVTNNVKLIRSAVLRSEKILCKMAIQQKLESAEEICTEIH